MTLFSSLLPSSSGRPFSFFLFWSLIHIVWPVQERGDDGQILCVDCEKDESLLLATIWSSIRRRVTISPFEGIFSRSTVQSPPVVDQ
jgi:hypothetical protein